MMNVVLNAASQKFGRYQLLEYLGSGGMSDVFRAVHTGLRKVVALKLLRPSLRHDECAVERFLREGECAARVSHPNIVEVTDVGEEEGVPYLVMELLEGETLEQKLKREGPLPLRRAIDLLLPILDGVAAIHRAGVLHRDIKPSNILLARTQDQRILPKLVDFGIATLEERRGITGALGPLGTPQYMSPEQARGQRVLDERSDQYSLASVLFEMLTGRTPFDDDDPSTVLSRVAQGRFPRVSEVRKGTPPALDEVLARATAFDPAGRFASVSEFAEALLPLAGLRTNDRRSLPLASPAHPEATATRVLAALSGMAVLAFIFGLSLGFEPRRAVRVPQLIKVASSASAAASSALRGSESPTFSARRPLAVTPASAEVMLDGVALGSGSLDIPVFEDERVHELRIAAPGYVTRVELFRGTIEDGRIALEAVRAQAVR